MASHHSVLRPNTLQRYGKGLYSRHCEFGVASKLRTQLWFNLIMSCIFYSAVDLRFYFLFFVRQDIISL